MRLCYVARWLYWAVRHRSFKHAAWVCAVEGLNRGR